MANDTQLFKEAQDKWLATSSKDAWDQMFLIINHCCAACLKKFVLKNKIYMESEEFNYISLDCCVAIMNRYKKPKGYFITYPATVCKNAVFDYMTRPKRFAEIERMKQTVSYEQLEGANIL